MRYKLFIYFFVLSSFSAFCQTNIEDAEVAFKRRDYEEAKVVIDEILKEGNVKEDADYWFFRGQIYSKIAGDFRGIYTDLDTLSLFKSYDAFVEAMRLYKDNEFLLDSVHIEMVELYETAVNSAGSQFSKAFQREKRGLDSRNNITHRAYDRAYQAGKLAVRIKKGDAFDKSYLKKKVAQKLKEDSPAERARLEKLYKMKLFQNDSLSHTFASYSALSLGEFDEYITYNLGLIDILKDKDDKYRFYEGMVAICRDRINDLRRTIKVLDEALIDFPEDEKFQTERINLNELLGSDQEKLLEDTKAKIKADPRQPINYYNLAIIYQRMEQYEAAIDNYKKCLELDISNIDAIYHLGGIYYNKAVNRLKKLGDMHFTDYQIKGEVQEKIANEDFKISLKYFEELYNYDQNNILVLKPLYNLYTRLRMSEKLKEIKERISIVDPQLADNLN